MELLCNKAIEFGLKDKETLECVKTNPCQFATNFYLICAFVFLVCNCCPWYVHNLTGHVRNVSVEVAT